jgi:hypothetical protein
MLRHECADLAIKNHQWKTPLYIAVSTRDEDLVLVELILRSTRNMINEPDIDNWNPTPLL